MLPDFESMVRVPLVAIHDAEVQRGVELHHRTDEAFHRAPAFLAMCSQALDAMASAGVRRGTARAVGHIASEMFLDGWLAREPGHVKGYLGALSHEVGESLEWEDDGHAFSTLRTRLTRWGAPCDYAEPAFVLERLDDALRQRPALSILPDQSSRIAEYLPDLRGLVEADAPELLHEVQNALGLRG
jgi:hypothetical protein